MIQQLTILGNIFSMKMKKEFTEDVQVIMPKFNVKTDMEISEWLKAAGVNKIFQGKTNTNISAESYPG